MFGGDGGGRLFSMTFIMAVAVTAAGVGAAHYLAENVSPAARLQAFTPAPVRQTIASFTSKIDPEATGSVKRNASAVVLDPCTGARKN